MIFTLQYDIIIHMVSSDTIQELFIRYPALECIRQEIEKSFLLLCDIYTRGKKVLIAGNGGSASDAEHIVGELMKGFCKTRPLSKEIVDALSNTIPSDTLQYYTSNLQQPLEAISLVSQSALITAFANDVHPDFIYAQQVLGYGKKDDMLIVLSTSGNSKNIVHAVYVAKALGVKTIAFTGKDGGAIKDIVDVAIVVPAQTTLEIQELHLPIYHALCKGIEENFFEK